MQLLLFCLLGNGLGQLLPRPPAPAPVTTTTAIPTVTSTRTTISSATITSTVSVNNNSTKTGAIPFPTDARDNVNASESIEPAPPVFAYLGVCVGLLLVISLFVQFLQRRSRKNEPRHELFAAAPTHGGTAIRLFGTLHAAQSETTTRTTRTAVEKDYENESDYAIPMPVAQNGEYLQHWPVYAQSPIPPAGFYGRPFMNYNYQFSEPLMTYNYDRKLSVASHGSHYDHSSSMYSVAAPIMAPMMYGAYENYDVYPPLNAIAETDADPFEVPLSAAPVNSATLNSPVKALDLPKIELPEQKTESSDLESELAIIDRIPFRLSQIDNVQVGTAPTFLAELKNEVNETTEPDLLIDIAETVATYGIVRKSSLHELKSIMETFGKTEEPAENVIPTVVVEEVEPPVSDLLGIDSIATTVPKEKRASALFAILESMDNTASSIVFPTVDQKNERLISIDCEPSVLPAEPTVVSSLLSDISFSESEANSVDTGSASELENIADKLCNETIAAALNDL